MEGSAFALYFVQMPKISITYLFGTKGENNTFCLKMTKLSKVFESCFNRVCKIKTASSVLGELNRQFTFGVIQTCIAVFNLQRPFIIIQLQKSLRLFKQFEHKYQRGVICQLSYRCIKRYISMK